MFVLDFVVNLEELLQIVYGTNIAEVFVTYKYMNFDILTRL